MSRIVNVTLAGPGSFALTRVIQKALFDAGYSVNAGDTAMDVVIPTRGCDAIEIDASCEAGTMTMQGEAVLPFEQPRTQLEIDAAALAGMVFQASDSGSLACRLARRILAETTGFEEPKTNG